MCFDAQTPTTETVFMLVQAFFASYDFKPIIIWQERRVTTISKVIVCFVVNNGRKLLQSYYDKDVLSGNASFKPQHAQVRMQMKGQEIHDKSYSCTLGFLKIPYKHSCKRCYAWYRVLKLGRDV